MQVHLNGDVLVIRLIQIYYISLYNLIYCTTISDVSSFKWGCLVIRLTQISYID